MHIMVVKEDINSVKKAIESLDKELEQLNVSSDVAKRIV